MTGLTFYFNDNLVPASNKLAETILRGGIGSIIGTFLGVCLIQVIRMGLINAEIQTNAQRIVVGFILIAAATFDALKAKGIEGQ